MQKHKTEVFERWSDGFGDLKEVKLKNGIIYVKIKVMKLFESVENCVRNLSPYYSRWFGGLVSYVNT